MISRLVLSAAILPAAAGAQPKTVPPLPSLLIPLEPPEPLPASGTAGGYLFNLRPLGADFGRRRADHGVYIAARNLSGGLGNVSGGIKRGWSYEGTTTLGLDLDMDRIAGFRGGAVHFLVSDLQASRSPPTRAAPT